VSLNINQLLNDFGQTVSSSVLKEGKEVSTDFLQILVERKKALHSLAQAMADGLINKQELCDELEREKQVKRRKNTYSLLRRRIKNSIEF